MPSVSSIVIEFIRKELLPNVKQEILFRVVKGAFSKRRKTLFNALKKDFNVVSLKKAIVNTGFSINVRGEELSLEEFIRITKELY